MTNDTQIRDRLDRAARVVRVDVEGRLDEVRASDRRVRIAWAVPRYALAVLLAVLAGAIVWQARSPDDRRVIPAVAPPAGFLLFGGTAVEGSDSLELSVLDVATGHISVLTPGPGRPGPAQWSPDGTKIAMIREMDGGARVLLVVTDADGSNPVTLVDSPKAEGTVGADLVSLAWSPDGSHIAYSGRTEGRGRTVATMKADGTDRRVLDGLWVAVAWSPDGRRLLVEGYPGEPDDFDLYSMNVDGSGLVRLTNDPGVERGATWSPDGNRIVFSKSATDTPNTASYEQDVYVMNADGSDLRRVTTWAGLDLTPVWSTDGNWIAFSSDRDATAEEQAVNRAGEEAYRGVSIYAMRPDGSDVRILLRARGNSVISIAWR